MSFDYFLNMSNSEKIYLLIVIVLIIALVLFFLKTRSYTKSRAIPKVQPIKPLEKSKPVMVEPLEVNNKPEKIEETGKIELDNVLEQMKISLMEQQEVSVKTFEEEQEEKSIISYQELLKANKSGKTLEADDEDEKEFGKPKTESEYTNQFRNSEFISPIYGRVDNDAEYPTIPKIRRAKLGVDEEYQEPIIKEEVKMLEPIDDIDEMIIDIKEEKPIPIVDLEQTISSNNLKEEMIKNEKFLNSLKDFRKNLE